MKTGVLLLGMTLFLASCASVGGNLGRISVGMDKAAVIQALGNPTSVGGASNVEVLHYRDHPAADVLNVGPFTYYFVRCVDGKVESYGPEQRKQPVTDSYPPLKTVK